MMSPSFSPLPGQTTGAQHSMDARHDAALPAPESRQNGAAPPPESPSLDSPYDAHLAIEVEDWDVLFEAVKTTLRRIVGERLGDLPEVPAHSAALSASLVQAVVLDCVGSLDRLHTALKQERSQRPTP
jgi:hypothetical protein